MGLLRWAGTFDAIEDHVAEATSGLQLLINAPNDGHELLLTPTECRTALYDVPADASMRTAMWRYVIRSARLEETPERRWRLCTVWMAIPGLRRTAFRVSSRLGADRRDIEAEMVLAVLEELHVLDLDAPDPGLSLLRAARRRGWEAGRRALAEVAVEDVEVASRRLERAGGRVEFYASADCRRELTVPLRVVVSRKKVEGDSMTSLAQWLLVTPHVRPGPMLGRLPLGGGKEWR
ncbi:hypothetical protein [Streptomyces sp. URMC 129]|uniref:hypothetical protein n=1 Tax=Streptomyces sp. URMC 129 TaxID=3423407 RepID=UPI003F1B2988